MRIFFHKLFDRRYNIGFVQEGIDEIMSGKPITVNYLKHDLKNHWFADPFVLDVTASEIVILVEDFDYDLRRGRISALYINRDNYELKSLLPLLTLPTHLSYPIILREKGKVYVYPESGASGKLTLYELDPKTMKLSEAGILAYGDIADATMTSFFGKSIMFATSHPHKDGKVLDVLEKNEEGYFEKKKDIAFHEVIARQAGDFFMYNDKIVRVAQESNQSYGHAVVLQEVIREDDVFSFKEIRRLYSPSKIFPLGLHTFNQYKDIIVVDSIGYYHPSVAAMVRKLANFF